MSNDFEYKYVAPTSEERKEIESIRNNYVTKKQPSVNLDKIRKLDNRVRGVPTAVALIIGICGTLIFGLGLTMILEWNIIAVGVIVCILGLCVAPFAHPVYNKLYKHLKDKYAEEIIRLSNEALGDVDE